MLYMTVYTFGLENRDEVTRRRATKGPMVPSGIKMLGEWTSIEGGRVFRLVEAEDPGALFAATYAWNDLGNVEHVPVMETEEALRFIQGRQPSGV
jgi:hypothetical protein